jgi:opacity protein-like surface antigen
MKKVILVFVLFLCVGMISNAQSKMSAGVNAGVAFPMGDFGDGYKTGFGGSGVFSYMVTPEIALTGSIGYLTWTSKESSDATFRSIPVLVGGRYYFGNLPQIKFFGAAELGLHMSKVKIEVPFFGTQEESNTNFGFGIGGGASYSLNKDANLELSLKYNNISTEGSSSGFVTIMAGFMIAIH